MLKNTYLLLPLIAVAGISIWQMKDGEKEPLLRDRESTEPRMADPLRRSASSPEVGETHDEIPRSRRHADGAIEKHQAGMLRLMELENAVKEQETELEKKRKVVEAIVWTKGAMFMKNHPGSVPLSEIPKRTGSHDVEAGDPQDTMNTEDIRERSQSATGYADAKRDFETDLEQLKQLQLERDREKGRLKKQVR